jgi:hypothetical protein
LSVRLGIREKYKIKSRYANCIFPSSENAPTVIIIWLTRDHQVRVLAAKIRRLDRIGFIGTTCNHGLAIGNGFR